jgi:hypothetical protein
VLRFWHRGATVRTLRRARAGLEPTIPYRDRGETDLIISVVNRSRLATSEVRRALRSINRQIARDFEPRWDLGAEVRLAAKGTSVASLKRHGHAVVKLRDEPPPDTAPGFHTAIDGQVDAVIYTQLPKLVRSMDPWLVWTADLSHEILEIIADPEVNILVKGPHPGRARHTVFHYREVCDPVQATTYEIDGVTVSNFVLPHYYNGDGERKGRNDFLHAGVEAFRWLNGGYIGFWDPTAGEHGAYVTFPQAKPSSAQAKRLRVKGALARLRRYARRAGR